MDFQKNSPRGDEFSVLCAVYGANNIGAVVREEVRGRRTNYYVFTFFLNTLKGRLSVAVVGFRAAE